MKKLYFVRHGESEFNRSGIWAGSSDTPLTELGHQQAKQAGKHLKKQGLAFDVIISSPLERAHHTAKHIATEIDYPHEAIVIAPQSVERSFGELEGNITRMLETNYFNDETAVDNYKDVEKLQDMQKRAKDFLAYLDAMPHNTILVVGHGAFARALRRAINNEPLTEKGQRLDNAEIVRFI